MATFPESDPTPNYPLILSPRFNTVISDMDSGAEERTSKWLFPKYDVGVKYSGISAADAQTLWNFFLARRGAYEAFYIYDLALLASVTKSHVKQYVGTATETGVQYHDIPGRSTSGHAVYVNGVEMEQSGNWIQFTGGGTSDSDRLCFNNGVLAVGDVITVSFSGYLRIRARFAQDFINQELFTNTLYRQGLEMKGLAAA
jgi:hypothetical protein